MKKRKFAEGGALEELATGKSKGSFDEDVYKRAQAFLQRGDKEETAAEEKRTVRSVRPKTSAKITDTGDETERMARRAPALSSASAGRAEIPVDPDVRGPEQSGRIPSDLESNIINTASALTPIGVGGAMRAGKGLTEAGVKGWRAGRPAAEIAKSTPRVGDEVLDTVSKGMVKEFPKPQVASSPNRFTPKQELEAAESTLRGKIGRKEIQAKRASREASERAAAKKEDIVSRRSGNEFAKGGRIDGCAIRGKTRGRMR